MNFSLGYFSVSIIYLVLVMHSFSLSRELTVKKMVKAVHVIGFRKAHFYVNNFISCL